MITANRICRNISLLTESRNDVISIKLSQGYNGDEVVFSFTLLNTLLQSICTVMNLDDNEINGMYQTISSKEGKIIIFETSEGGTGTLSSFVKAKELFKRVALKDLDILHYEAHLQQIGQV